MKRLAIFALASLLVSCATAPAPSCTRLASDGWFCPLPPWTLAPRRETDLVTVTYQGAVAHYVALLSITHDLLTLGLSNLAGIPLGAVTWNGRRARAHPGKNWLDPKLVTALLEFALAPQRALDGALHGLVFTKRGTALGSERRLVVHGDTIARAVAAPGVTLIEIPKAKLVIAIRPVKGAKQ